MLWLLKVLRGENPLFTVIYLFAILFLINLSPGRAQDLSPVIVSSAIPSHWHPRAGEKVSITVHFDMTGSPYLLGSFSGTLTWNPALLQYQGHSGILAGFSGKVEDLVAGDGAIIFRGSHPAGRGGVFNILELHFLVREPGGHSATLELKYSGINAPLSSYNLMPFLRVDTTVLRIGANLDPNIQLPVTFYHFGAHTVGSTTTRVFWINNIGAEPLLVSATEITDSAGGEFTILEGGAPFTVLPWQGHSLVVAFTPASAGEKAARLNIYSNDPDENPAIIDLAGTGLNPPSGVVTSAAIPSSPALQSGDTLSVSVRVDMSGMSLPYQLLGSFTGMLTWDPVVLQYTGNSGILQGFSGVVDDTNASEGVLLFNGAKATGQEGAFDIVKINFAAAGEEESSTPLDLEYIGMLTAVTFTNLLPFLVIQDGMVMVQPANINHRPVLTPIADQFMAENQVLTVEVTATDPDEDALVLTALHLPPFASFFDQGNGSGAFTFAPGFEAAGYYPDITVIASDDGDPVLADTISFSLRVSNVNRPPVLEAIANLTLTAGETLHVPLLATDPDGDSLTLTVHQLPAFGSFTNNGDGSGLIRFTPAASDTGSYPGIMVIVTDNDQIPLSDTASFSLTVSAADQDHNPPDCALLGINPGPPATLQVRLQDGESGLAQVKVLVAVNVEVDIPVFIPGTTDPVIVSATKIDPNRSSTLTLEVFDLAGHSITCDPVYTLLSSVTPENFTLAQNYPNPFNPTTTIEFAVAASHTRVSLKIYDLTGRLVKTLINEKVLPGGYYRVTWNGTTDKGDPAAAGVYLYRMAAGDFARTRRMMLLK